MADPTIGNRAKRISDEEDLARQYGIVDHKERVLKYIKLPDGAAKDEDFYREESGQTMPNVAFLRLHFYQEGHLTEDQVLFLLRRVTEIFSRERNLLRVQAPVTICGDIHGQYYDMVHFMTSEFGGNPLKTDYLFLGDYVDRGYFSVECLLWLFSLKIARPDGIHMLRGNHETKHLTNYFTFRIECTRKYSERIYDAFLEVFKTMPLAAIVDNKFFCVHGGISPDLHTIHDIDKLNRFVEVPTKGLMCDLLWSDPAPPGSDLLPGSPLFLPNPVRGCSYYYTYAATCKFLENNSLLTIIRGHEVQEEGHAMLKYTPAGFPSVITIFSAPNYCDAYGNKGAVLTWTGTKMVFKWFWHSPHPFWLPNLSDAFSWSLPFVAEKALQMLQVILDIMQGDEEEKSEEKGLVMSHVYGLLRETGPESATEFRNLPLEVTGYLGSAADACKTMIPDFEHARTSDIINEHLPPILIPAGEAREFYTGKGIYALPQSKAQLVRKTSVGTTKSSSPSTRKRGVEVNLALIRRAAELLGKVEIRRTTKMPTTRGGKLRSRKPEGEVATKEENTGKGVEETIELLKALQATFSDAREMAEAIRFVEEEE